MTLRMTVYIRFKPSHLPGSLETNGRRDHVDYYRTQDQLFSQIGDGYCRMHVPRYHRGHASSCAFTIGDGRIWPHDEHPVIMQTRYLQRGDLFERPASKACGRVLLGLDGIAARASGSCRRETRLFGAARLLMGRARACGVDRRLARFLLGLSTTGPPDLQLRGGKSISRGLRPARHTYRTRLCLSRTMGGTGVRCGDAATEKKARERPMAEQVPADHTKRQLHHLFGCSSALLA